MKLKKEYKEILFSSITFRGHAGNVTNSNKLLVSENLTFELIYKLLILCYHNA